MAICSVIFYKILSSHLISYLYSHTDHLSFIHYSSYMLSPLIYRNQEVLYSSCPDGAPHLLYAYLPRPRVLLSAITVFHTSPQQHFYLHHRRDLNESKPDGDRIDQFQFTCTLCMSMTCAVQVIKVYGWGMTGQTLLDTTLYQKKCN